MTYTPFYIDGFETGLEKDKSQFQLLTDAFAELNDAYVWRQRVLKKKTHTKVGRLTRILTAQALANTSGPGSTHIGNIKTFLTLEANAEIGPGSVTITVAAPGAEIFTEPATPDGTLVGDGGGTGNINYATGAFTLTGGAGWGPGQAIIADFDYAPGLPCMGIYIVQNITISEERTVAFDTSYMYVWNGLARTFQAIAGTVWTGTDADFFWLYNYNTALAGNIAFITNFNEGLTDPIYYYDVSLGTLTAFAPAIDGVGNELHQAKIIVPYKGRVVALNIYEGANLAASVNFPRRARWSWVGDPLDLVDGWLSDEAGKGGYIDAPTAEHIISVEFVRDDLIVGFEKSHWMLKYTGNVILPFVWKQIDNEFGIESTFSVVRIDKAQVGISATGVVACDGVNVQRIDEKIPDAVFNIENENEGVTRVHGIRDYDKKLIYWTYPDSRVDRKFPNKFLVYNYDNASWAFFRDNFTALGYLQETNDLTWATFNNTWAGTDKTWVDTSLNALYPDVIGGNQQGYIARIQGDDAASPLLAITAITPGTPVTLTIPDHNLEDDDYIRVSGILGTISGLNDTNYRVEWVDANNITLWTTTGGPFTPVTGAGTYLGSGEVALLPNVRIRTKKYNALGSGKMMTLGYIDFIVDVTPSGLFNVDIFSGQNDSQPVNTDLTFFNNTVETSLIPNFDNPNQEKVIHRMFANMESQFAQFEMNLTPVQKLNSDIVDSSLVIYSMIIWGEEKGRLT